MEDKIRYISKISRNCELYKRKKFIESKINSTETLAVHLIRHHEGLTQEELRKYLDIDKSLVTRIITKLEQNGFVEKRLNQLDKRSNCLFTTSKAKELKEEMVDVEEHYYQFLFQDLSPLEKENFFKTLEKIYIKSKQLRKGIIHEDDK